MLQGIYAPIPTPFRGDDIAFDWLKENVDWWGTTPLHGLVVGGSNGEFALQSFDERKALIAFVREHLPARQGVIAGTGCESTRDTIRLTKAAAAAGVAAALVVNPNYYKGEYTDATLKKYFLDVAEASPIPVLLYNMPRNTGINLSSKLLVELAKHPNVAGVKDSGGNIVQISEVIAGVRPDFAMFSGSASFLLPTLAMGGVGGTLALANVLPHQCVELYDLALAGRMAEARLLQLKLLPMNAAVTSRWGIPGLKAAMELIGKRGGEPRLPIQPLPAETRAELKKLLLEVGTAVVA